MKNVYLFLMAVLLFFSVGSQAQAVLKGSIKNGSAKEKLSGADVTCTNNNGAVVHTVTDYDGEFKFKNLTAGEYDLKVEYVGFSTYTTHVSLVAGKTTEVKVLLMENTKVLADVRVFGKVSEEEEAGARAKEQRANNIVNVISARAMERSPDINAAGVLQRMSGLTLQTNGGSDEAYPIIRGLDPSYSNTLINGIKIASPDDKSRYVPLNIVPSDLLGSIEVHKSLLPEMEGDAIGGTVNMVMKDAPQKEVFKVLGSLGYSKIFIDRNFIDFSKSDIQQKSVFEKYGTSYYAKPDDFSRSNLEFKPVTPVPNSVLALTYGRRFLHDKLGMLVAENFQDQYYGSNSVFNQAVPDVHANGAPTLSDYANRLFSTRQLNNGVTIHLDYNLNDRNKLTLTSVSLYSYLAQSRVIIDTSILGGSGGRTVPGTGPVTTDYTSVTSRQFLQNFKLDGKHILSSHFLLDWTGVFSYAAKRSPDMADLALDKTIDTVHTTSDKNGPYTFKSTPTYFDQINRVWQHNEDKDFDGIVNLTYKTQLPSKGSLELKAGGLYRHKTRYNIQDEYYLRPTTVSSNGIKQVFIDMQTAQWTVFDSTGTYEYGVNNYKLHENITAGYGEFKLSFRSLDIFGGVRVEKTDQGYTLNAYYPTGINAVQKNYTDVLPSIMLKYKLNARTNLRFSYYKGISRPNFYDLVPALRLSASNATSTRGNPYLNHTVADNFDIRYELYPAEEEAFFVGAFYKNLINPIERAYIGATTDEPQNFGNARDYGAELVYTKYFGHLGVTGNYTYIHSRISSTKSYYNLQTGYYNKDTLQPRSLQGQTDHVLNLSLLYKDERAGLFAQLAFMYTGKSISVVYPIYGYDYFQRPQADLALSAEKRLHNPHWTLFSKFNNLLNTAQKNQINNLLLVRDISKFNFSFGLRYAN